MNFQRNIPIRKKGANKPSPLSQPEWIGLPDDWKEHLGFVYIIRNKQNGRFYVGKKLFWKAGGKVNNRITRQESDWRKYWGSSKELVADIKSFGRENFTREIIECHNSKSAINLAELCWQIHLCLKDERSYNGVINFRSYISKAMREIKLPWIIGNDKETNASGEPRA